MAQEATARREDLILKVRYQALKSNIERVRALTKDLQQRKDMVDNLTNKMNSAYDFLLESQSKFVVLSNDLKRGRLKEGDVLSVIQGYANQAGDIADQLKGPIDNIENFQAVCKYLNPQETEMSISKVLDAGIPANPDSWVARLETLYADVLSTPAVVRKEAWTAYRGDLYTQSQQLFRDYVQLLGGLAVRDMELDRKICRFADELLRRYALAGSAEERLLTIPTRMEAVRMTWSRVVRLGFPEWSIWALPCTAHELWFVVARRKLRYEARLQNLSPRDELCLADAFATWTVGPAYAYAATLLQLNPYPTVIEGVEQAPDDDRLAAITYMLTLMGAQPVLGNGKSLMNRYESVITKLRNAWADAQERDASPAAEADNAAKSRIDVLFGALNTELRSTRFSADNWDRFQKWPELLQEGNTDPKAYEGFATADARWVLNAAWEARVKNVQEVENIEKAATRLMETLYPERSQKSRQTAPGA
jgi:hypothetical protein